MSDSLPGSGTTNPSGRGTHSGGNVIPVIPPPPPPIVTNQQLLVLDSATLTNVPEQAARGIKLVQLEFAGDVSALAAAAYDRIIQELRPQDD